MYQQNRTLFFLIMISLDCVQLYEEHVRSVIGGLRVRASSEPLWYCFNFNALYTGNHLNCYFGCITTGYTRFPKIKATFRDRNASYFRILPLKLTLVSIRIGKIIRVLGLQSQQQSQHTISVTIIFRSIRIYTFILKKRHLDITSSSVFVTSTFLLLK